MSRSNPGLRHRFAARRRVLERSITGLALACAITAASTGWADAIPPTPIPDGAPATAFIGAPGKGTKVKATKVPQHPFMSKNATSNIHNDAFMTDTYAKKGPIGQNMQRVSYFTGGGPCASITFDKKGRIIAACIVPANPQLKLFDPKTLNTLASMPLPPKPPAPDNLYQDFSGGGYFYLDNKDRAVLFTADRHIHIVAVTGTKKAPAFTAQADFDLTSLIPDTDRTTSVLPDWSGRIWFVTLHGIVGALDPATAQVESVSLGEAIENSFAVDDTGGVYIVTDKAQYRFDADTTGKPSVTWREMYKNSGIRKPSQVNAGSGTTPTLLGDEWLAITDNADPMNVVVYRRKRDVVGSRVVCEQPVFSQGASATENSLIGAGRSLVVENNYGYTGPTITSNGASTTAGLERVDINADGHGCSLVWHSDERAPSVVAKLSLATGLVYTYTKDAGDAADPWYLTALDFATGETKWKQLAGTGVYFNNNYAPVTIGPDGSAYVGTLGGLVKLRDGKK